MLTTALTLAALSLGPPAREPAQQTDTTIAVRSTARLDLSVSSGRVDVKTWDRPAVRIVAAHAAGITIDIRESSSVLTVRARSLTRGRMDIADFEITVPRAMSLVLGRGDVDITVVGSEGEIDARNYSGKISVDGGRGVVMAQTNVGEIRIGKVRGRIKVEAVHGKIEIAAVAGDVDVQSSDAHVVLQRVDTRSLSVVTVDGYIDFVGPLHADGRYALTTHDGWIRLRVPDPIDATVSVTTIKGAFSTDYKYTIREQPRRGRFTAVFGTGAAQVELESFDGSIRVNRPGG